MNNIPNDYKSYFKEFVVKCYEVFYDEYNNPKTSEIVAVNPNKFQKKFDELICQLEKQNQSGQVLYITNAQFLDLMEISKKKALAWRNKGKINFIQLGNKTYYKVEDIQSLINFLS